MKDYHINIFYSEEDGGYIADIPDLKYCSAFGSSEEEALKLEHYHRGNSLINYASQKPKILLKILVFISNKINDRT